MTTETKVSFRWIADLSMLAFVCFMAGVMWFQVNALAADVDKLEGDKIPERVARIEQTVKYNGEKIDDLKDQAKQNHKLLEKILRKVGDD